MLVVVGVGGKWNSPIFNADNPVIQNTLQDPGVVRVVRSIGDGPEAVRARESRKS